MTDIGLTTYEKYRKKTGFLDLEKILTDPNVYLSQHLHDGVKKIEVIHLPNGMVYYAKPVGDVRGASAEVILSKMYQLQGFISPETTLGELDGRIYSITNDVLPSHNTERGYIFLRKLCPGGEQHVLPSIYKYGEKSKYYKSFSPEALKQIPVYYGLSYATRNWDANYCNLNFRFQNKVHDVALGLVSIDYEKSHDPGEGYISIKYTTPFDSKRALIYDFYSQFVQASRDVPDLVNFNNISNAIKKGHSHIDEIVYSSRQSGFVPDQRYVDDLKSSMEVSARAFERE